MEPHSTSSDSLPQVECGAEPVGAHRPGVGRNRDRVVVVGGEGVEEPAFCSTVDTCAYPSSSPKRLVDIPERERPTPSPLRGFRPAEVTRIRLSREQDVAALPDYALSHSTVAVLPDRQREKVLAAVRRMATEHPDLIGRDHVTVPMQVVRWIYHPHN